MIQEINHKSMKTLNLYRIFEIMSELSYKQSILEDENTFIDLLGSNSNFSSSTFERFLEYYSFKIEDKLLVVFNDDSVPYEDYTNSDFSYIPLSLLEEENLDTWVDAQIKKQLREQEEQKVQLKERLKLEIERLQRQLDKL